MVTFYTYKKLAKNVGQPLVNKLINKSTFDIELLFLMQVFANFEKYQLSASGGVPDYSTRCGDSYYPYPRALDRRRRRSISRNKRYILPYPGFNVYVDASEAFKVSFVNYFIFRVK